MKAQPQVIAEKGTQGNRAFIFTEFSVSSRIADAECGKEAQFDADEKYSCALYHKNKKNDVQESYVIASYHPEGFRFQWSLYFFEFVNLS